MVKKKFELQSEFERVLRYDFTYDEKAQMGQELGRKYHEGVQLEIQKSSVTKQFTAQIEAVKTDASALSQKITNGYEYRPIKCESYLDNDKLEVFTIRFDSGEEVERRPMNAEERQRVLFGGTDREQESSAIGSEPEKP